MSVTVLENEDLPRRECTYVIKWDSRGTVEILYYLQLLELSKFKFFLATMKRLSNVVRRSSMFVVAARKSSALPDSVISFNGRGSISELPARKINYENTYRMGPDKKPSYNGSGFSLLRSFNGQTHPAYPSTPTLKQVPHLPVWVKPSWLQESKI